ncbi:unnamed protein product [Euphydryas editha]|uniref:FP protein C-terminal domain-containing protein n=1 Tax=Euphydryas editha TaxID=104508 RepID=A0AAU9TTJ8_EUPED|nr:unnamed protein product [Euphydryas editha]
MQDMFKSFEYQQNLRFEKLIESMCTIKEQNSEIQKSIDFLSAKYDDVLEKINTIEQKSKFYELKIESLENKIEQLERNSHASAVELKNIPKMDNENKSLLRSIVKKVGEIIQQPVIHSDIKKIIHMKTRNEMNNHIVVNFNTTTLKDDFIKECRVFNKKNSDNKLNTSHLQIPTKPIFVDESLTSVGRKLSVLARQLVKDHKYHSTRTSYGRIYLRKNHDSPVTRIDTEKDIQKLLLK